MKNETKIWLGYSNENLTSARLLLENELFNPCLQNVQQCVEKALKSLLIENSIKFQKTHNISELKNILLNENINITLSEEDCDFLDSIYIPSKYPVMSVLPHYNPDLKICKKAINIAATLYNYIKETINS